MDAYKISYQSSFENRDDLYIKLKLTSEYQIVISASSAHLSKERNLSLQKMGLVMTPEKILCPVCERGEIIFKKGPSSYCYKGHDFTLEDIEYCECPACRYEIILPEQSKRNEARIRDEHRKIDGLFTRVEITQLREQLKITQNQAAQLFGERVNMFSKYESFEPPKAKPWIN